MDAVAPRPRWYRLTPGRLVLLLLAAECVLWLSNRLRWPEWHKGYAVLSCIAVLGEAMLVMLLWWLAALVFRRRFQFSIRTLLLLVVAVALPFSWLAVEMKKARQQAAAVGQIVHFIGAVYYEDLEVVTPNDQRIKKTVFLSNLFGDDFFVDVVAVVLLRARITDASLDSLKGFTALQFLDLSGTTITDVGLKNLKGMTTLQELDLAGTDVSDAGLENLKGLISLQILDLAGTDVSDAGLESLKGLTTLRELNLRGTRVTDAGLESLKGLTTLRELNLHGTRVTDAGLESLKGIASLQSVWSARVTVSKEVIEGAQRAFKELRNKPPK